MGNFEIIFIILTLKLVTLIILKLVKRSIFMIFEVVLFVIKHLICLKR